MWAMPSASFTYTPRNAGLELTSFVAKCALMTSSSICQIRTPAIPILSKSQFPSELDCCRFSTRKYCVGSAEVFE